MTTKINQTYAVGDTFVFSRCFEVPPVRLFAAWTDPEQFQQWWGPLGFTNPVCELDARPNGVIRIDMKGPDGTVYPMSGAFQEIIEPEHLAFTTTPLDENGVPMFEVQNRVSFTEQGGGTILEIHANLSSVTERADQYLEGMEEGWSQSLDRLAEQLATDHQPLVIERTFHAPVAKVWKALTTKKDFDQWFFELNEFKPEVGFEFQFEVEHAGTTYSHLCKVTEVVPERKLAYTWRYEGKEGDSLVSLDLFAHGEENRVRLTHEGLETFPKTSSYARSSFAQGWTMIIGVGLRKVLESTQN
jgi:uncharacterized protein YndB with AHSA1/START domain